MSYVYDSNEIINSKSFALCDLCIDELFKRFRYVLKVLNEYERIGIQKVELGSVHTFFDVKRLKQFNFDYVINNYFPPPKVPFNFNLVSEDKTIRKRSILLVKTAIELCNQINGSLYSSHAGFTET